MRKIHYILLSCIGLIMFLFPVSATSSIYIANDVNSSSFLSERGIANRDNHLNVHTFAATRNISGVPSTFLYTDLNTHVTFEVPTNWEQKGLSKEREFIDVKFVSADAPGFVILYGSCDIWSALPQSEKSSYKRSELDNSIFTKTEWAEMLGLSSSEIEEITYNGSAYFKVTSVSRTQIYEVPVSITTTQLYRMENGWLYSFYFYGDTNDPHYQDFEQLVYSAKYPDDSNYHAVILLISAVSLMLGICIFFVFIKRNSRTKFESNVKKNAHSSDTNTGRDDTVIYCHICGEKLPPDSTFCHKCGTKIIK